MRALILAATAGACWSSWRWLVHRTWGSPEEAVSLLAALALVAVAAWSKREDPRPPPAPGSLMLLCAMLLMHAIADPLLPPIVRAGVASVALLYSVYISMSPSGERPPAALWVLGLLATPIVPTLQFYLGYPMRLISAAASVLLLQMNGLAVTREGTYLSWQGELVQFDAPCSGVSMLWAGLLLTTMAAYLCRLSPLRLAGALAGCGVMLLAANILRATSLFYLESGAISGHPGWLHEASGIAAFAMSAVSVVWLASRLQTQAPARAARLSNSASRGALVAAVSFSAACAVAAMAPLTAKAANREPGVERDVAWPQQYESKSISQLPLSPRDSAFTLDFPGRVGRFTDGSREIVIRHVTTATRKLHPASDCFRGLGYAITPVPMRRNSAGQAMSCFEARGRGGAFRVCEHLQDQAGGNWPDVGAWYWSALFSDSGGGWLSFVVAERI